MIKKLKITESQYNRLLNLLVETPFDVVVKNTIKAGDIVGLVGSTGMSTGPHLHLEVSVNGTLVNPVQFIKRFGSANYADPL